MHPLFRDRKPTLHISHRGGAALAPENTMVAFRQAVERYHTDMLETDVHLSRDGVVVVAHDPTVDRCTDGTGAIAELTLAELRRLDAGHRHAAFRGTGVQLPTLEEVLTAFPRVLLNIELKAETPELVEAFVALVRKHGAVSRVCCGSESDAQGERLAARLPEGCHFYPRNALTAFVLAAKSGEPLPEDPRFTVLDMPLEYQGIRLVDPPFLEVTRAAGKWVNVWTIDDPAEMQRLIADGVGGIMTDRPDLLVTELSRAT